MRFGERLIREQYITNEQLDEALRLQIRDGSRVGSALVNLGHLDLDQLAECLGRHYGMPATLSMHFSAAPPELQGRLSSEQALCWGAIPVGRLMGDESPIAVAVMEPLPPEAVDELSKALGGPVVLAVTSEIQIQNHLLQVYGVPTSRRVVRLARAATEHPDETDQAEAEILLQLDLPEREPVEFTDPGLTPPGPDGAPDPDQARAGAVTRALADTKGLPGDLSGDLSINLSGDLSGDLSIDLEDLSGQDMTVEDISTPHIAHKLDSVAADEGRDQQTSISGELHAAKSSPAIHPAPISGKVPGKPLVRTPGQPLIKKASGKSSAKKPWDEPSVTDGIPQLLDERSSPVQAPPHTTLTGPQNAPESSAVPSHIVDSGSALGRIAIRRGTKSQPTIGIVEPGAPSTFADSVRRLRSTMDRDRIADVIVDTLRDFLAHPFDIGAVLVARGDAAIGWKGFWRGRENAWLKVFSIPLQAPSCIHRSYAKREIYIGPPEISGRAVDSRLWQTLGCQPPTVLATAPLAIDSDNMCLLYAHSQAPARGDTVDQVREQFTKLSKSASRAFKRVKRAAER